MSVQVEPSQLRYFASRFSSGAQEIRTKATRLETIMNELVEASWKGEAAHAFAVKCEVMKGEMQKTSDVLYQAVDVLNRFAYRMDRVIQLRSQANLLEQQSWSYSGDSIDDLHHRQNLERQALQLRQEAEWEANVADEQAASEFQMIMAMIPQIMEQMNQYTGTGLGNCELDDLPEPMRSYYLRHRDLLDEGMDQSVAPLSYAQMKRDDETYIQDHEQLLEAIRQYYMSKMPDYLSEKDRAEAAEDDMKYMYDLTNSQLYDRLQEFVSKDEQFEYYAKLVQQPDFDAQEHLKNDPGYKRFVADQVAQNDGPAGFAMAGMTFAAGIMKALQPRYSSNSGTTEYGKSGQVNEEFISKLSAIEGKTNTYTPVEYQGTTKVDGEVKDISRRVYQRSDIDWNQVDPETGLTNLELMKKGRPPLWKDGTKVELHHTIQIEPGPMVELPASLHDEYSKILHGLVENGGSFRNNPALEKQYNNFRSKYWRWRAKQIEDQK